MISIIICSKYSELNKSLCDNIEKTIGVAYEIIHIDNSQHGYSIFSAYNLGWEKSKYPYTCFVHEDVLFHTPNWGEKIINHLQNPTCGIVGIAGGALVTNVPGSWSDDGGMVNIIQSNHHSKKRTLRPHGFQGKYREVVLLDGVFLCMRRELLHQIRFDETIGGFHGYDLDISIQSHVAGYSNFVIYDVLLEHFSIGDRSRRYYDNLLQLFDKWEDSLPIFSRDYPTNKRKYLFWIEKYKLKRLLMKLVKNGFSSSEIEKVMKRYSLKINKNHHVKDTWLQLQMQLVQLLYAMKKSGAKLFGKKQKNTELVNNKK